MKCLAAVLLLVMLVPAWVVAAEPARVIDVWPGKAPGETKEIGPEEIQPAKPGENPPTTRITNVSRPTLHVFPAPKEKRNGAAIVICPGGGFRILAWDKEGTEVAAWANSIGVTAIVLKYRTPTAERQPRWQAPLQDTQRAISLVRSQAAEWNVDPARIGVLGFSAGGEIASLAAVRYGKRDYESLDVLDNVSCRPDFAVLIYPAGIIDEKGELKSDYQVSKETPPIFFAHAFNDGVKCEASVQLFLALKKAGVASELHVYSAGGHGFGLRPSAHPAATWPKRCEEWLGASGVLGIKFK
ncbi:MAG: alpha/beta hydrolase [Planctomycetales bacterium]|nr:alpha/beta hydrolase [Planctomycetales bacterium]